MREIKFRAWDKDIKEMFDVDVLAITPSTWGCPDYGKSGVSLAYQPHISVMQYTGLKDKNGKEIYEGDIVRWVKSFTSPLDMRTKRKIDSKKEVFQQEDGKWVMGETCNTLYGESGNVEIIGNIYENPELLEENK